MLGPREQSAGKLGGVQLAGDDEVVEVDGVHEVVVGFR
jgi:hypothetical protein